MTDERIRLTESPEVSPPLLRPRPAEGCSLVLFGASGDLARRKLFPALYQLLADGLLPENLAIVASARSRRARGDLLADVRAGLEQFGRGGPPDERLFARLAERIDYASLDFTTAEGYDRLAAAIARTEKAHGTGGNRLYYLATPPGVVPELLEQLTAAGLLERSDPLAGSPRWDRVIFEKPFGRDSDSAARLNQQAARHLDESQVFRIDHYLGKETVQNILVFRFANEIFEPLWNRQHVAYVEITAAEQIGLQGRGAFYDDTGALRDVVQNHLLQVLALTAMEPPVAFTADSIRDEKVKLLRSLRPLKPGLAIRGQYRGYDEEGGVHRGSRTETFAAVQAHVDNWRWRGVPFYLRAGKRLAAKVTEVAVHFRHVPHCLFGDQDQCPNLPDNVLRLRIQPDEGIGLCFASKVPGSELSVGGFTLDFRYAAASQRPAREAYERLLLNALQGDATLFARRDGVAESWRYVQPVLDAWQADGGIPLHPYEPGGEGPAAAAALLESEDHRWTPLR